MNRFLREATEDVYGGLEFAAGTVQVRACVQVQVHVCVYVCNPLGESGRMQIKCYTRRGCEEELLFAAMCMVLHRIWHVISCKITYEHVAVFKKIIP